MRTPEALLVGRDGPAVVVSGRMAAFILSYAGRLDDYHRDRRGEDPEVDAALTALKHVALEWRSTRCGTTEPPSPLFRSSSPGGLSTAEAARRLGLTPRGVRKAIDSGRLPAVLVGHRWVIDPEEVGHFHARRVA